MLEIVKKLPKLILTVSLIAVVITAAYLIGFGVGVDWQPRATHTASASRLVGYYADVGVPESSDSQSLDEKFKIFWEVWDLIERDFYGPLPDDQERVYSAIRGMISSLGDEHTAFLTPEQTAIVTSDDSGSFEGIGASIRLDESISHPRITEIFEEQPAAEAGLLSGDIILAIDDTTTKDMTVLEAISLIRGPKGSTVHLTIQRESESNLDSFVVPVVREKIDIPIIEAEILEGNVAYLRLTDFNIMATEKLQEALKGLLEHNPRGLVFDLRGNPGGFLHVAVEIGSQFVPAGNIVTEKTKDGTEDVFEVCPGGLATDSSLPLVVLINQGTASAAEIVAAAIQDSGRGILLGDQTFGKSSVQVPHGLSDGSELRVTIARWFAPSGNTIEEGLTPDIEVEMTVEDIEAGQDTQKKRAVEYILATQ